MYEKCEYCGRDIRKDDIEFHKNECKAKTEVLR
jgi:hypothetical protein